MLPQPLSTNMSALTLSRPSAIDARTEGYGRAGQRAREKSTRSLNCADEHRLLVSEHGNVPFDAPPLISPCN